MIIAPTKIDMFVELLRKGKPFAFSRYGDGEWISIFGVTAGANRDGNRYLPELGAALRSVLESRPPYMLSTHQLALQLFGRAIDDYLRRIGLLDRPWYDSDVFHHTISHPECFDGWRAFLAELRKRPVVVVGPPYMKGPLSELIGAREFVFTPDRDSILVVDRLAQETREAARKCGDAAVICISCGMAAEVLLDAVYEPDRYTIIDCGSVWDPYCGCPRARYARRLSKDPSWQWPR